MNGRGHAIRCGCGWRVQARSLPLARAGFGCGELASAKRQACAVIFPLVSAQTFFTLRGMATDSDRLLVQQIRQSDARAWEHLIARYEGRLFAFVHRRIKDLAACE